MLLTGLRASREQFHVMPSSKRQELHAPILSEARADARCLIAPTIRLDGRTHTRDVCAAVKTRLQMINRGSPSASLWILNRRLRVATFFCATPVLIGINARLQAVGRGDASR